MNFVYEDTMIDAGAALPVTMCQYGSNSIAYCCSCYTVNTADNTVESTMPGPAA